MVEYIELWRSMYCVELIVLRNFLLLKYLYKNKKVHSRNRAQKTHNSDFSATKNLIHIAKSKYAKWSMYFYQMKIHTYFYDIRFFVANIF